MQMRPTTPLVPEQKTDRLTWGVIEFQVTDLVRTIQFWTVALGLTVRSQDSTTAELGTAVKTLFILRTGASKPVSAPYTGLYHVAIGMADQFEFSRMMARMMALRVPVSPVDHLGAKSFYLNDPDGIEIEFTLETPERFSHFGDMKKALVLYDVDGNPHSGREPLDVQAELALSEGLDLEAPLPTGTFLAHMHFKVPDLDSTATWFEGLGFARNLMLDNWGFGDMAAGAAHTHRLAMNVWAGKNRPAAPADMARLTHYTLLARDADVLEAATGLTATESGKTGRDPTGTQMSLILAD
jgi:catechol 2,3-dioxygenase